ncbi:MAG: diguanylate cyclase [Gammaproteobacteria bacterium]
MHSAGKLCILCCRNFHTEIAAVIAAEEWKDVCVADAFPSRCGRPPENWSELHPLLKENCSQVAILGGVCLSRLGEPPPDWPPVLLVPQEQCFHLVACRPLVADAMARGAYLLTPGWLRRWPEHLAEMGFKPEAAAAFFHDVARELLLLDTGVDPQASQHLAELSKVLKLPARSIPVGLDQTRLFLNRMVTEWRREQLQDTVQGLKSRHARERADHIMAIDCLSRLGQTQSEAEVINAIRELFRMLFAPEEIHYLRIENGSADSNSAVPPVISQSMCALEGDYDWTPDKRGFLLHIKHNGQVRGIVAVERVAFPEYRERYLNLAMSLAGVCALAIENVRASQRTKTVENVLREKEERLALATLINGVGIWDWNLQTQEMIWDDSMYALYHIRREDFSGTEEAWRTALHPDDLARGDREVEAALAGEKPFNTEFRVCWPSGEIRYIKAVAKVFRDAQGKPVRMLGTNTDITERKLLQTELEKQARTDFLTGVGNRRYFREQAEAELKRALRYGSPLSVLMLDIDFFKKINDRHGHQTGDSVLQKLADICRAMLRDVDLIGRLGGEEFAILLPETEKQQAAGVAERLRQAIANTDAALAAGLPVRFTVSIGVASLAAKETHLDELLNQADQALYEAKASGRNKVMVA